MQKREFEKLVGKEVTDEAYSVIEQVYVYHPVISEVSGKEEVAELYKSFGIAIFYDMQPRAVANMKLEKQLSMAQAAVIRIKEQRGLLRNCRVEEFQEE